MLIGKKYFQICEPFTIASVITAPRGYHTVPDNIQLIIFLIKTTTLTKLMSAIITDMFQQDLIAERAHERFSTQ